MNKQNTWDKARKYIFNRHENEPQPINYIYTELITALTDGLDRSLQILENKSSTIPFDDLYRKINTLRKPEVITSLSNIDPKKAIKLVWELYNASIPNQTIERKERLFNDTLVTDLTNLQRPLTNFIEHHLHQCLEQLTATQVLLILLQQSNEQIINEFGLNNFSAIPIGEIELSIQILNAAFCLEKTYSFDSRATKITDSIKNYFPQEFQDPTYHPLEILEMTKYDDPPLDMSNFPTDLSQFEETLKTLEDLRPQQSAIERLLRGTLNNLNSCIIILLKESPASLLNADDMQEIKSEHNLSRAKRARTGRKKVTAEHRIEWRDHAFKNWKSLNNYHNKVIDMAKNIQENIQSAQGFAITTISDQIKGIKKEAMK